MIWSATIPLNMRLRHRMIRWLAKSDPIRLNEPLVFLDDAGIQQCYLYDSPITIHGNAEVSSNIIRMRRGSQCSAISVSTKAKACPP